MQANITAFAEQRHRACHVTNAVLRWSSLQTLADSIVQASCLAFAGTRPPHRRKLAMAANVWQRASAGKPRLLACFCALPPGGACCFQLWDPATEVPFNSP